MIGHMRDRGSLIQLLDAFGIEQTEGTFPRRETFIVHEYADGTSVVVLGGGSSNYVIEFDFDEKGFFTSWGICS